jgi:cytochrome b subunit of formate dehydrogenase
MKAGYKQVKRMTTYMRINHWVVAFSMLAAIIT